MHLKHACLPFHHLSNLRKVESGTPGHQCKKKAFVPTLAKRGIFANSRPAMSPDPADSSRPPEDSIKPIDLSSLGFGPSWVDGPNENIGASRGSRREGGDRPSFREGGNRGPSRGPGGPSRGPGGPSRGPGGPGGPGGPSRGPRDDRRGPSRDDRGDRFQDEPAIPQMVVTSGFFPDDAKFELLGDAMKKSQITYELFSVALLILDKEDRLSIVIRPADAEKRPDATLSISVPDSVPFLTEAEAVSHVLNRHLDKFFDTVEVETEAPKGSFLMVARCKRTGAILGSPTHHSYQKALREHHARTCPNAAFDRFKADLEMVREPEAIEAWKKSMSTRTEYAPKDRQEGEPERLESMDAARGFLLAFRREATVISRNQVRFPGRLLAEMPPGPLRDCVRYALDRQRDFPLDTANGIRGRLRKEGFHLYKKGSKGITYACGVRRKCRDPKSSFSDSMQKIFDCLDKTSGIQGKDVTLAVAGETADDAAKARVLADLNFLIGEGYIAKLHDGRLFAQPVLSTQAQAKEEAANEDASEEK